MVRLLIGIHLNEATTASLNFQSRDSIHAHYKNINDSLYKDLGLKKPQVDSSFKYYSNHPDKFDDIYTSVVDSLSLMQTVGDAKTVKSDVASE